MLGWRLLSYAVKKGLEKCLAFQSADYKNLRVGIFHNDNQAQVTTADDGLDPALARHLTVLAALYGYDGSYLQRLRVDSAYWLKVRSRHSLTMRRLLSTGNTLDPSSSLTVLSVSGAGVVLGAMKHKGSGVAANKLRMDVVCDGELSPYEHFDIESCNHFGFTSTGTYLDHIVVTTWDTTNNVYEVYALAVPPAPFNESLEVKLCNNDDANSATVDALLNYAVVSGSSKLKFTLEKDISELDPTLIGLYVEDMLRPDNSPPPLTPRPVISCILAKESLEEGQPPTDTLELILDRDYDDDEVKKVIDYVESEYKAKLMARW